MTRPSIILRDAIHRANKIIYHTPRPSLNVKAWARPWWPACSTTTRCQSPTSAIRGCTGCADNRFEQMTLDHSLLQELVDRGFYSQQEAQRATNKNYVTRALGVEQNVEVEIHEQPVQKSDYYVLCSDGLSDMIEDEDIHLTISTFSANLDTVAKQLIQLSNDNGGRDNVSVIMAHVAEPFPAQRRIFDKILGWFGLGRWSLNGTPDAQLGWSGPRGIQHEQGALHHWAPPGQRYSYRQSGGERPSLAHHQHSQ